MKHPRWILGAVFAGTITVTVAAMQMQQKGGVDAYGPYDPVANWLKPVRAGYIERGASVFVESPNKIFYTTDLEFAEPAAGPGAARAPAAPASEDHHFVMILDANGKVTEEWKQWDSLFKMPHAVKISKYDPEKAVWIVDRDNSQVFKFTHDGKKLLMTLGEKGVIKSDNTHFGRPADIAFQPDGSFYIADGYANRRVIKFDKTGKFLFSWGSEGAGPGQFNGQVHDVAIDSRGRVLVGDRGNDRVQVFDANGKFIEEWPGVIGPSYLHITKDNYVWVVSGRGNRLAKFDLDGKLQTYWGTYGRQPGGFDDPHDLSVDADGNLYVSIYSTQRAGLEKYTPRKGADRSRLVGPGFDRSL